MKKLVKYRKGQQIAVLIHENPLYMSGGGSFIVRGVYVKPARKDTRWDAYSQHLVRFYPGGNTWRLAMFICPINDVKTLDKWRKQMCRLISVRLRECTNTIEKEKQRRLGLVVLAAKIRRDYKKSLVKKSVKRS